VWGVLAAVLGMLAVVLARSGLTGSAPALAQGGTPQEHLAANFEILVIGQVKATKVIPERDQRRTADCLSKALAADVPDADATKLSAIFEGRAPKDPALQKKWLTITKKDAPARNAQVLARVDKMCADLGPYVRGML
jgi:hypothetical protein